MPRITQLNDALHDYMLSISLREPDVLRRLREDTAARPHHSMQISPDQGQFMTLLMELIARVSAWKSVPSPAIQRYRWRWHYPTTAS